MQQGLQLDRSQVFVPDSFAGGGSTLGTDLYSHCILHPLVKKQVIHPNLMFRAHVYKTVLLDFQ